MNKKFDEQKFYSEMAAKGGRQALEQVKATIERTLQEVDSYIAQYDSKESESGKADVLNWTMNYLTNNVLGNCRIDILANRQAELTMAADLKRRMEREIKPTITDDDHEQAERAAYGNPPTARPIQF
jgi:hypothetical protein